MLTENVISLKCRDCSWSTDAIDIEEAEHVAWDHLGKYREEPLDHTIEATAVTRYRGGL